MWGRGSQADAYGDVVKNWASGGRVAPARPENLSVGHGALKLRLPAQRSDGAEISPHQSFRDGSVLV